MDMNLSLIHIWKQYLVRFKIEPNEDVHVHDIIRGEVVINSSILDEMCIRDSYNTDDNLMKFQLPFEGFLKV